MVPIGPLARRLHAYLAFGHLIGVGGLMRETCPTPN
jgi:hypothetical protein